MQTRTRSRFVLYMAVAFLAIALVGFSTTFFVPLARGSFSAPPVIHVHAALLFGWLLFLILQSSLVHRRSLATHRRLGSFGAVLAGAIVVSGVLVGLHATRRDLAAGGGEFALGQFVNILIEMLLFGSLVAAAIAFRRSADSHKTAPAARDDLRARPGLAEVAAPVSGRAGSVRDLLAARGLAASRRHRARLDHAPARASGLPLGGRRDGGGPCHRAARDSKRTLAGCIALAAG
jgi:hypothetical protein